MKTRLREGPLREIAEITEGVYIPAHTRALPLGRLFRERIESRPVREDAEDSLPQYQQHYAWFLGGALAAAVAVGRGERLQPAAAFAPAAWPPKAR